MQAGKESWRQGRKGRTVEGRSTGTAAEGPERRRKKNRAATEEKPKKEEWRKTATTKERTVIAGKPSGDGRRAGTVEGGDFPTFSGGKGKIPVSLPH